MRAHWDSITGTRKLNKHYQSSGRITPPALWGSIMLLGCGGCISSVGEYGLILESDGIYVCNMSGYQKGIYLATTNISTLQGNIMPLFYILYESININGSAFPDLRNSLFSDSTGLLKFKYTTLTLTKDSQTETANAILVYINKSDLSMGSQYVTNAMNFNMVKWHYPFRLPQSQPLKITVNRLGLRLMDNTFTDVGSGNIAYEKTYSLDVNGRLMYTPPTLGSGISLSNSFSGNGYHLLDNVFGGMGLYYAAQSRTDKTYDKDGVIGYDQYDDPIPQQGFYDNFDVSNIDICYTAYVTISDNDGLYFDKMRSGSDLDFNIGSTPYNITQIARWV